jgi:threonine/homoserine/homoserine lactone efflux protein
VYVIHQTLQRGYAAGLSASFAPFLSDGPIIALAFFVLSRFENTPVVLGVIAIAGAAYLMSLAWRIYHSNNTSTQQLPPSSFFTAVKINLLNPIPYFFWMTAGGLYLIKGSLQQAALFVVVMLATLGVTKFLFAASIRMLGQGFSEKHFATVSKVLALILLGFAIKLCIDGIHYFEM